MGMYFVLVGHLTCIGKKLGKCFELHRDVMKMHITKEEKRCVNSAAIYRTSNAEMWLEQHGKKNCRL